jgi:hypothetical protein
MLSELVLVCGENFGIKDLFEGFAIEQLTSHLDAYDRSYFWSVHEKRRARFFGYKRHEENRF